VEEELAIIKSLIKLDRRVALGARYFRSTEIDRNCELIFLPFFRDFFREDLNED
jgi:hypothetical protein